MSRTASFSATEAADIRQILNTSVDSVDAFGDLVLDVYRRYFNALQGFYYHFYDGRLHFEPRHIYGFPFEATLFPQMVQSYRPFEPADLLAHGLTTYHVGELYALYSGQEGMVEDLYRDYLSKVEADWGATCVVFDGPVMMAVTGIGRPFAEGDLSAFDLEGLRMIHPWISAGFLRAATRQRSRRFGRGMATAVEYHPHGLFLLTDDGAFRYANHTGRLMMQEEVPGHSAWPMASISQLVSGLGDVVRGTASEVPGMAGLHVKRKRLERWQDSDGAFLNLIVAQRDSAAVTELTGRQRDILTRLGEGETLATVSTALGISPQTVRVHLRNAYRRLGVSGLDEALTLMFVEG